jgi:phasin protein
VLGVTAPDGFARCLDVAPKILTGEARRSDQVPRIKSFSAVSGARFRARTLCYIRSMEESKTDSTSKDAGGMSAAPVRAADLAFTADTIGATAKPATSVSEQGDLPRIEIPLAFREIAETIATLANASFDIADASYDAATATVGAAAGPPDAEPSATASDGVEAHTGTLATTAAGATEYGLKVMEAACINANAMIAFTSVLLQAKSLSEVVALSTAHARKQIETVTEQTKQLAAVAEKMAPKKSAEPGV